MAIPMEVTRVSTIIPVCNRAAILQEAAANVLTQSDWPRGLSCRLSMRPTGVTIGMRDYWKNAWPFQLAITSKNSLPDRLAN